LVGRDMGGKGKSRKKNQNLAKLIQPDHRPNGAATRGQTGVLGETLIGVSRSLSPLYVPGSRTTTTLEWEGKKGGKEETGT